MHRSTKPPLFTFGLVCLGALSACTAPTASTTLTYFRDAKPIIDTRCGSCHRVGDIAPFPLTSYEEVKQFAGASRASIESGSMPPWQPSDECNAYAGNFNLTPEERKTLLAWFEAGAPEGDPATVTTSSAPPQPFATDVSLKLPEPYAPAQQSDDYRCQLIPWPATETRFVTGIRVKPDQRAIVHHVIVFMVGPDQVAEFRAYDAAEAGPGYTCFGGPRATTATTGIQNVDPARLLPALAKVGLTPRDLQTKNVTETQFIALSKELGREPGGFRSLGSWVPGAPPMPFRAGTGIRVEPGSMLVAQVHYNTSSSASTPDQSVIELATTNAVEREATMLPGVDLGWVTNGFIRQPMTIPAGMADVRHSTTLAFDSPFLRQARQDLKLPDNAPLTLHTADHHMHSLGTSQRTELRRADGSTQCLLETPDWDFDWQGRYTLAQPVTFREGDTLWLGCTWDNSAANQPFRNGVQAVPGEVKWGENTSDEMCLAAFYVTAE